MDKPVDNFKIYKNNFANLYRNPIITDIIEDLCSRTNKVVCNTHSCLRTYFCYLFENDLDFPVIDTQLLRYIISFVSSIKQKIKRKSNYGTFNDFYKNVYSKLEQNNVSRDKLGIILNIETRKKKYSKYLDEINKENIIIDDKYKNFIDDMKKSREKKDNDNEEKIKKKIIN